MMGSRYEYRYLIAANDALSPLKITIRGPVFRVLRPRWKDTPLPLVILRTMVSSAQALVVLLRTRPHAIVSSGPGPAVPASLLAKLLGIKVVFIETGSRVSSLSSSGRILYRFADLFFVQWPQLLSQYPEAIYAGRLL
jgi:UDP-N-acetylglucosamine:LPS N-acetylglucosamine transferase